MPMTCSLCSMSLLTRGSVGCSAIFRLVGSKKRGSVVSRSSCRWSIHFPPFLSIALRKQQCKQMLCSDRYLGADYTFYIEMVRQRRGYPDKYDHRRACNEQCSSTVESIVLPCILRTD